MVNLNRTWIFKMQV